MLDFTSLSVLRHTFHQNVMRDGDVEKWHQQTELIPRFISCLWPKGRTRVWVEKDSYWRGRTWTNVPTEGRRYKYVRGVRTRGLGCPYPWTGPEQVTYREESVRPEPYLENLTFLIFEVLTVIGIKNTHLTLGLCYSDVILLISYTYLSQFLRFTPHTVRLKGLETRGQALKVVG